MDFVLEFIKTPLLILIPFSWIVGLWLKRSLSYEGENGFVKFIARIVKETSRIKVILYVMDILISVVLGFVFSDMDGWRLAVDALLVWGIQGVVCAWCSTRLYDKVREQ